MVEEKILKDLGLTDIEAKVYLACLELGSDTVLHIAKKAEVKRPTAYVTLDNLQDKGYVSKLEKKNTTFYSAEQPKILLNKYKEKIANFTDLLPYFEAKFNKGSKPRIRFYEGVEDLNSIYRNVIFPSKEIYFFGTNMEKLLEHFPNIIDHWYDNYAKKNSGKNIFEIVSNTPAGLKYAKRFGKKSPIRLMPKDLPVYSDVVITENKIFIVSLDDLFGVLIESTELAKTFKSFFLLAWRGAEILK